MGGGQSSTPGFQNVRGVAGESRDFFQDGYDDAALWQEFNSQSVPVDDDRDGDLVFPSEYLLTNMLLNPKIYTNEETADSVFENVLAELFCTNKSTSSRHMVLIENLLKFLRERINPFIDQELMARMEIADRGNIHKADVVRMLDRGECPHPLSEAIRTAAREMATEAGAIKAVETLISSDKEMTFEPYHTFTQATSRMKQLITTESSPELASACFKLGMFAADIECVFRALMAIGQLATGKSKKVSCYNWSGYKNLFRRKYLKNAVWLPHESVFVRTTCLDEYQAPQLMKTASCTACDGLRYYAIGHGGTVFTVELSKCRGKGTRFRETPLGIGEAQKLEVGLGVSNGHALIVTKTEAKVFRLPSFDCLGVKECQRKGKGKIKPCVPMASDSRYIYCLWKYKKIQVFSISNDGSIIHERSIELFVPDKSALHDKFKDMIPKFSDLSDYRCYCNGAVFSILLPVVEQAGNIAAYVVRSFSLIDGGHIEDDVIRQRWAIESVCYDPLNSTVWALSFGESATNLVRLPAHGPMPSWMGGCDFHLLDGIDTTKVFKDTKTHIQAFTAILTFLEYHMAHFFGSVLCFSGRSPNYCGSIAAFFGDCSPSTITAIMTAFQHFAKLYHEVKDSELKSRFAEAMKLSLVILDYNLANFLPRTTADGGQSTRVELPETAGICTFLWRIVSDERLAFLHRLTGLLTIRAFSALYDTPTNRTSQLFLAIHKQASFDFRVFMTAALSRNPKFAVAISATDCRTLMGPMVVHMANLKLKPELYEVEFISAFLRNLMLQMRQVYLDFQGELSSKEKAVSDVFVAFSNMISEQFSTWFESPDGWAGQASKLQPRDHPFFRIFCKWVMLLEPFYNMARASKEAACFLQPVYTAMHRVMSAVKSPIFSNDQFTQLGKMFLEVFSLYSAFVTSLLDGGVEMKWAAEYQWLIKAAGDSELKPDDISKFVDDIKSGRQRKGGCLLRRGFSFNIVEKADQEATALEAFVRRVAAERTGEDITQMMSFLYKKVNNVFNRQLKEEDIRLERLLLAALVKQLGFTSELTAIAQKLRDKENVTVVSHFVRQSMESIYRIRRKIRESKQITAQLQETLQNQATPTEQLSLMQQYDKYVAEIFKKAVFLLHIQPCLRFGAGDSDKSFSEMLKRLEKFLVSPLTVDEYFQTLLLSKQANIQVSIGMAFIIDMLGKRVEEYTSEIMMARLSRTDALRNLIEEVERDSGLFGQIEVLMKTMQESLKQCSGARLHRMTHLILSLTKSLKHIAPDKMLPAVLHVLNVLLSKRDSMPEEDFRIAMHFVVAALFVMSQETGGFSDKNLLAQVKEIIFPNGIQEDVNLARLCMKSGMDINITEEECIALLNSDLDGLQSALSVLEDLMSHSPNVIQIFGHIFATIGSCLSGLRPVITGEVPFSSQIKAGEKVTVPLCVIARASLLIQFCRKFLSEPGPCHDVLQRMVCYVLKRFDVGQSSHIDQELAAVEDPTCLLAVFALLSNAIDGIQKQAFIKDVVTSAIYYVENIDTQKMEYLAWTLPITPDCKPMTLPFSSRLVAVCGLPFRTSYFRETELLVPYFERLFANCNDVIPPVQAFLCMSCMREYLNDLSFLNAFMSKGVKITIPAIVYGNSRDAFLSVIRSSILNGVKGLQSSSASGLEFYGFSPAALESRFQVTKDTLLTSGTCLFVTSFLPEQGVSMLELSTKSSDFDVGLYSPDISETGAEQLLVSVRHGQLVGKRDTQFSRRFIVKFDPTFGGAIYSDTLNRLTDLKVFPNPSSVCFIVIMHNFGEIRYSLVTEHNRNVLPLAGNTVMTRRNVRIQNRGDLLKHLRSRPTLHVQTSAEFDASAFMEKCPRPSLSLVPAPGVANDESLIAYPHSLLASLAKTLDWRKNSEFAHIVPCFAECALDEKQAQPVEIPVGSLLRVERHDDAIVGYHLGRGASNLTVDPLFGNVSQEECELMEASYLPALTPMNYNNLPPHFLKFFAQGYNRLMKAELTNHLLLKLLSTASIPVAKILEFFSLDLRDLVEHFVRMLLYVEEIDHSKIGERCCPVKFDRDVLADQSRVPSYLHIYKDAIVRLHEYLQSDEIRNSFMSCWFTILKKQFNDPFSHSCHPESHTAFVKTLDMISSPFNCGKKNAKQWIILRATPARLTEPVARVVAAPDLNVDIADNIVLVPRSEFSLVFEKSREITIAAIPIVDLSPSCLIGSFYELVLSFKYFVRQLKLMNIDMQAMYRKDIYAMVFDSLAARSPFFVSYPSTIFSFLTENIPCQAADMSPKFVRSLNLLGVYSQSIPCVAEFLQEQQFLYDERVLLPFKSFFPAFLTESEKTDIQQLNEIEWGVPSSPWPEVLTSDLSAETVDKCVADLRRVLLPRTEIVGMPIQLFVWQWLEAIRTSPPYTSTVKDGMLCIKFHEIVPPRVALHSSQSITFQVSGKTVSSGTEFDVTTKEIVLHLQTNDVSWYSVKWCLIAAHGPLDHASVLHANVEKFTSDMRGFLVMFDQDLDRCIMQKIAPKFDGPLNLTEILRHPDQLLDSSISIPWHMVCLRAFYLGAIGWLASAGFLDLQNTANQSLVNFLPPSIRLKRFRENVLSHASNSTISVTVNRKASEEVRDGNVDNLQNTIIYQLSKIYRSHKPSNFRSSTDRPWSVSFTNERGIDAGGPARELVTEAAIDLCTPNCGLVKPVPNGRNEVGDYQDLVIPYPNPKHRDIMEQYKFAGVLIGMAIRTSLAQDFPFPRLVWDYLVSGDVKIERVFEIDHNYKLLIQSLEDAQKSDISEQEFASRFNLTMVVTDFGGAECPLTQRGRLEPVTLSTCGEYIALANEYRRNELKKWLEPMRQGLWENLDFEPDVSIDGYALQFTACGDNELTVEALKAVTSSSISRKQMDIFWSVVEHLTQEERGALLKFATGRKRLPPFKHDGYFLKIDHGGVQDSLPTASTCFYNLHLPDYSSYEKAYQRIRAAIRFANTMENA